MRYCRLVLLAAFILLFCAACRDNSAENNFSEPESAGIFAMNTYISLSIYEDNAEKAAEVLAEAQSLIVELESLWSVTDGQSEIYAVNHSGGAEVSISADTAAILRFALQMAEDTDGALEPTIYPVLTAWGVTTDNFRVPTQTELTDLLAAVDYRRVNLQDDANGGVVNLPEGMQLDLGAVGKGWAADETAAVLRRNGIKSALLDFGGNILTIGAKPDGSPWRIGVRDPDGEGGLGVLEIADKSVVVSGGYENYFLDANGERYWHILDPATGAPASSGLLQTAVVAGESKKCDALSTALFVMGLEKAEQYWQKHRNFEMILLTDDREIYITEGLSDIFSLSSGQEWREVNIIKYEQ